MVFARPSGIASLIPQNRTTPSEAPETSRWPSGEKATPLILPHCSGSVLNSAPSLICHKRKMPSAEPEASSEPSGEKATS